MNFDDQIVAWQRSIAKELASDRLRFPDVLDVAFSIKEIASDPESSMRQISDVVQRHTAFSHKVMKMSNMLAFNPSFAKVRTIGDAVNRIGMLVVRCLAFAVAAEELIEEIKEPALHRLASDHWKHTVEVAASAYVLDRHASGGDTDSCPALCDDAQPFDVLTHVQRLTPRKAFGGNAGNMAQFEALRATLVDERRPMMAALKH